MPLWQGNHVEPVTQIVKVKGKAAFINLFFFKDYLLYILGEIAQMVEQPLSAQLT